MMHRMAEANTPYFLRNFTTPPAGVSGNLSASKQSTVHNPPEDCNLRKRLGLHSCTALRLGGRKQIKPPESPPKLNVAGNGVNNP